MNSALNMMAVLRNGSNTLLEEITAEGAWAWGKLVGWGSTLVGAIGGQLLELIPDKDSLGLIVAGVALVVAIRAFQHDRRTSSVVGLQINALSVYENVDGTESGHEVIHRTAYYVVEILSRGPGVRYEVTGAVWAPENTVVAEVQNPQKQQWSVGDDPITVTIRKNNDHDSPWQDVFVGARWVTPGGLRSQFVDEGVRLKLPAPSSAQRHGDYQVWSRLRRKWIPKTRLEDMEGRPDPLDCAVSTGASFMQQTRDSHPSDPNPAQEMLDELREGNLSKPGDNNDGAKPEGLRLFGKVV